MTAQSQPNLEYKDADVKRDMDLVREILLAIESDRRLDGTQFLRFALPDQDTHEVGYTVDRLIHAGLVEGSRDRRAHGQAPMVSALTWEGHEFLDNIRDPGVWAETKEKAKPLLSVSLAVLAEIAKAEIRKRLGLA
jgi:predicted MarR family transcription regulator